MGAAVGRILSHRQEAPLEASEDVAGSADRRGGPSLRVLPWPPSSMGAQASVGSSSGAISADRAALRWRLGVGERIPRSPASTAQHSTALELPQEVVE